MRKYANEKAPLRGELFSSDQMSHYGKTLAKKHKLVTGRASNRLLKRLSDNEEVLLEVHSLLTEAVKSNRRIIPAGEWLLDNFYLIQEQILTGKKHLPKGYSEDLPRLMNGGSAGLPRIYDIATEIISHSDGRVDLKSLISFVTAYQEITHLRLGELWALPIMLRLSLIENIRRLATQIAIDRINQNLADYWAERMTTTAEEDPKSLILVIADMARSGPPMVSSFVAELSRQLQGKGPALALPLTWIEQGLSETGQTGKDLVNAEIQKQAADQVSMSNSISSLRFLGTTDWREFVETTSIVEHILREDIGGVYARMDFSTRDHYRHVVEEIAKHSTKAEEEISRIAIDFAKGAAANNGPTDRTAHVGFYLVDAGLSQVEQAAEMYMDGGKKLQKIVRRFPLLFYLGSILFITLIVGGSLFIKAYFDGTTRWLLAITGLLSLLCASQFAIEMINWLTTLFVKPQLLPRMDFLRGIPSEYRTLVVVPSILNNTNEAATLIESLEVYFLANRDKHLHFGLLTDFKDAPSETLPEDEAILQFARQRIEALNVKYGSAHNEKFFLLHRPRKWNAADRLWMGYERKRGKLTDLNALLRGRGRDRFSLIVADHNVFSNIKYVITIDSDTMLPRDSAQKFVSAMAHPLHQPFYDEKKQRVTKGYGILQPRVTISLPGLNTSLYARMHGNDLGIDPYTRTTSDVYQDLFNEGSFIGKGIYDVDTFSRALDGRFPENRILSHDLLEGCYTRSGLLSDVQLYEEYPSRYHDDVKRRHRWIRGDWQIATWFLPFVPGAGKRLQKNPLAGVSRWKIFDNIRRSLVPAALLVLLLLGWTVLQEAWFWTMSIIIILFLPTLIRSAVDILHKPKDILLKQHFKDSINAIINNLLNHAFTIICLPYEAYYTLDAIIRTNWRMHITRRHLLEWNPSTNVQQHGPKSLLSTWVSMWIVPFVALTGYIYIAFYSPVNLVAAVAFLIVWTISPSVAWLVSRPLTKQETKLTEQQNIFLHKLARKTWAFFETFAGSHDNWLPPDNYQEHPVERIAHRTSPTNIGLSLLANLSANDFGYITTEQFIERTANTLTTVQKMEKYRGHLFNWYDTVSLQPLPPRYISTVDSGNLVGHVLVLRQGILALQHQKIVSPALFNGLRDTFYVLKDEIKDNPVLKEFKKELDTVSDAQPLSLQSIKHSLEKLVMLAGKLGPRPDADLQGNADIWTRLLAAQCRNKLEELTRLAPWLSLTPAPVDLDVTLIDRIPTLRELTQMESTALPEINSMLSASNTTDEKNWLILLKECIIKSSHAATKRIETLTQLADQCLDISNVEYNFLYEPSQHLLSIGYNFDEHRKDPGFYDLLASEARLCSFTGIAQGKLPQDNWFALGRQLTNAGGASVLLSWSGSMFEYLMPLLVMPTYENTLLDQTNRATVHRQIEYGEQRDIPWGISESGYNLVDANLNYQYRAFGVPGLGLRRGLAEDLVIAPYASMLALLVDPEKACDNLERLATEGFEGRFGFFEAIDYTPSRLPRGQSYVLIRSFMAHHQGMSLLSLAYLLLDKPMQKRFEAEPQFQATLLLLQERIPKAIGFYSPPEEIAEISVVSNDTAMRVINTPNTPIPQVQLLSNGRYHVMVTNAGGGYSRWKDIAVTRWREDTTCDNWGSFCFIRDTEKGIFWSTAHQPACKEGINYEAVFSQGRAEFRRHDSGIETHTEIVVSPEDDMEVRRVHLTNRTRKRKIVEVTSYAEVVLTAAVADALHPAFSKLFVQTEILRNKHAILCTRRPRSVEEHAPWMFHVMKMRGAEIQEVYYETDRMQFIGRGNTIVNPQAMYQSAELSGSEGPVLDPIVSIRYLVTLNPHEAVTIDMIFGMADTRELGENLIEKYQDTHFIDRAFELAWTHNQVVLRQINASDADAQLYASLASSVIYANPSLRAEPGILIANHRGQSGLWGYSISGDLPIVLLQIEDPANIDLVRQLVQAHAYWRLKGLIVDLVIWNEDHGVYRQILQNQLLGLITSGVEKDIAERPGGIFVRVSDQIATEDRILIQTAARIIISDKKGTLAYQVNRRDIPKMIVPGLIPKSLYEPLATTLPQRGDLQFFNGLGGFSPDGREYIITTSAQKKTPVPWINVLANPNFGTVISESGQSYTWVENAHEFRLSPWNNDPVSDSAGEAFYIRDEESGYFWSPAPLPVCGKTAYRTRHGFGYSVFESFEDGIYSEMWVYVDLTSTIKFTILKIRNQSNRARRISATGYVEWVLGDLQPKSAMHIVTETDPKSGALFARNSYNKEFGDRVCFFDVNDPARTFTADRTEFIGRNGCLRDPEAMARQRLSGKTGAGLDPCGAMQVAFDLADGQEQEIIFLLGTAKNNADATYMVNQFRISGVTHTALDKVRAWWRQSLSAVQIETPDIATNILANGWLLYQTICCRIWARSGFYQSGGAFGFRDQLQDMMSVINVSPEMVRAHILLCASRQFKQGDVQHWWHPPTGRGVRTRCSDDFLWLPLATCRYVFTTGDKAVLDEPAHFLEGRLLNPDEESYYDLPGRSGQSASLYDHCVLAIQHGLRFGERGLPLIGSGDWNDGMDRVGRHGKGESVWLGFFLYHILIQFEKIARSRNDIDFAEQCIKEAALLKNNIEKNAWDGEWYRRAWFDDGTPLGSAKNEECRIDSIAQSWSILSGAADASRSQTAMESAYKYLVRKEDKIIQLLDPPFNVSALNPGYIKGYVPGVRENGGQYTHAAIWLVMAFAAIKNNRRSWELFTMINPINHGSNASNIATYKVEPYVVAADVYSVATHKGRGGWTWYTGSAGWMYRLIIESLLGLEKKENTLEIAPCIPEGWNSYVIHFRHQSTPYHIKVTQANKGKEKRLTVDGIEQAAISLLDDGREHQVEIILPPI
jgi:cellobiose phosphorylase